MMSASTVDTFLFCMIVVVACVSVATSFNDKFSEELFLTPLTRGFLSSDFRFTTTWNESGPRAHYRLFPRSLVEILDKHHVRELHLSFTQGQWRHNLWGYAYMDASPGVELWTWFHDDVNDIDKAWNGLCNALSGLFCASLNFIHASTSITPHIAFRPYGLASDSYSRNSSRIRYATLPREVVCTENLTPWKKLLPCGVAAGLSTLLNAQHLYNVHFHSMGIHFRPVCYDQNCFSSSLELQQVLSLVSELAVEEGDKQDWSFKKLFNGMIFNHCPVATNSVVYVDISKNDTNNVFHLSPQPSNIVTNSKKGLRYAEYHLAQLLSSRDTPLNVAATYKSPATFSFIPKMYLVANKYIKGYGQQSGMIQCIIRYSHPTQPLKIAYLENIPSFAKVYAHTFRITSNGKFVEPEYLYIAEHNKREPFHLEAIITLPPRSVTEITIDFDKTFLKWMAYPPDANHGFYIGSSVITTVLPSPLNFSFTALMVPELHPELQHGSFKETFFLLLHTDVLLLPVPTPDFSMPYNVICLVCTVVALAFGPIHNITTKRLKAVDPSSSPGIFGKIKQLITFRFKKSSPTN